ncbi:MAG TPA: YhjD/YihY/BrkB family envelope integrity protein [Steroidobacteraceae bacterium]|nr:YhjD/YihY/BrkB family envelope integrity protein [Steroidobacteraceae bacterium]
MNRPPHQSRAAYVLKAIGSLMYDAANGWLDHRASRTGAALAFYTVFSLAPLVTAFLFTLGKFAIGVYIGNSGVASTYGAAGSVVLILIWVYYSAQILLYGAEFTHAFAYRFGSYAKAAGPTPQL